MGVLRNIDDERFCQLVVAGREPADAYRDIGGLAKNAGYAADHKMRKPKVRRRIEELLDVGARKAMLSRSQILQRIYEDWELSRKLGQMAAAATNAKLMGSELHHMFVERKEVGGPGDFDKLSADELVQYIKGQLEGIDPDDAKQLGIKMEDGNMLFPPEKLEQTN
jgi:hypothetical protein